MHGLSFIVLFLLIVVFAVVVFRYLNLPPILGYLSVGVLIGPYALGILPDAASVAHFSELGIIFLMFTIGLEFSLPKLKALWRPVLGLGGSQVMGTMLVFALLGWTINRFLPDTLTMAGTGWFALGGVAAMSSTAIVMKLLTERLELDSAHGRNIFSVLLFQDLAVVPLLILFPALAQSRQGWQLAVQLIWGLLKAAAVLALLLKFGQKPMRAWLTVVTQRRSNELFMLNLFLMTLAFAWLTETAGLSLALGAFIAGMLISETEFKLQVEEDIQPFKDILLGLFFIAMGMQLNIGVLWHDGWAILTVLILLLVIKFALIVGLALSLKNSTGNAVRTALALAPAGEFGLVLLNLALGNSLFNPLIAQWLLAAIILSMFITPFLMKYSDRIVFRLIRSEWLLHSLQITHVAAHSMDAHDHIIIAGFGRSGRTLARLLREQKIAYLGIDVDPENVQRGILKGHDVVYGDIARRESLIAAGAQRARALVITYTEPRVALHVLHHAQDIAPDLPVIVRTLDDAYLEQLQAAGAVAVVPEILEGSLVLATQTLLTVGSSPQDVLQFIAEQRRKRYDLLRQHFDEEIDPFGTTTATPEAVQATATANLNATIDDPSAPSTEAVTMLEDSLWTDQPLNSLPLDIWRVSVVNVVRATDNQPPRSLPMDDDLVLRTGDILTFNGQVKHTRHAALALNGQV